MRTRPNLKIICTVSYCEHAWTCSGFFEITCVLWDCLCSCTWLWYVVLGLHLMLLQCLLILNSDLDEWTNQYTMITRMWTVSFATELTLAAPHAGKLLDLGDKNRCCMPYSSVCTQNLMYRPRYKPKFWVSLESWHLAEYMYMIAWWYLSYWNAYLWFLQQLDFFFRKGSSVHCSSLPWAVSFLEWLIEIINKFRLRTRAHMHAIQSTKQTRFMLLFIQHPFKNNSHRLCC